VSIGDSAPAADGPPRLYAGRRAPAAGWRLTVLLVSFALVALWNGWQYHGYLLDDTFISLRYARNLVEGQGLVFNPGERVEGYTNFLLVLLAAGFLELGLDPAVGTQGVAFVMALITLWLLHRLERSDAVPDGLPEVPSIAVLLLLPLQAFAYWALSGMETMLFAGLLLLGMALALRESRSGRGHASAGLFVLLTLTRPEGALAFALATLGCLLAEFVRTRSPRSLRRHGANLGIVSVALGAYVTWRSAYYGHLLPNTFSAKVTGGSAQLISGLQYSCRWGLAFPFLAGTLLGPVLLLSRRGRAVLAAHDAVVPVYLVVLAFVAYTILVGGDSMPFFRFLLPVMPLCALLLAWTFRVGAAWFPGRWMFGRGAIAVACLLHVAVSCWTEQRYAAFVASRIACVGKAVGEWLRQTLPPASLIAVNTAGSLPYTSGLPTIDMLGLTDEQIAHRPVFVVSAGWAGHRRGWGAYVLERQPRVVLWYNSAGSQEPFYLSDRELADDPYFRFFYMLRSVRLPAARDGKQTSRIVARFLGFPLGDASLAESAMGDLGLRVRSARGPIWHTTFAEGPIALNYFEFDGRDAALWDLRARPHVDVDGFVEAVASEWLGRAAESPPGDPEVRREVETMCAEAYRRIQAKDAAGAKQILAAAARRNTAARSPLVHQYIANVAVITGELFVAVGAQKEALRIDPGNALFRQNLTHLLRVPYQRFRHGAQAPLGSGKTGEASGRDG